MITDYTSLQSAVANHAWKTLSPNYVASVPLFIQIAEGSLSRKLRVREQLTTVTMTPDVNFTVTLPSDWIGHYSITAQTSPVQSLEPIPPETADIMFPSNIAGWPNNFTIVGETLTVYPGNAADLKIRYFAALPPLAFNATNWLLTKMPQIYLYAALAEGAAFLKDEEELPRWIAMRDAEINLLKEANEVAMWQGALPQLGKVLP